CYCVLYGHHRDLHSFPTRRSSDLKFLINDNGQSMDYVTARSEFYIVCAGDIYTLMVTPKDISGQTIRLSTGAKVRIEENQKLLRSEEHTSELQSRENLVCRLLLEK